VQIIAALRNPLGAPMSLQAVATAACMAFLSLVSGWILALMLWRAAAASSAASASSDETSHAIRSMQGSVEALRQSVEQLGERVEQLAARSQPRSPVEISATPDLSALVEATNELRALVMMTEAQRQAYTAQRQAAARQADLDEARQALAERDWARAEQFLTAVEAAHAGDGEAAELRRRLEEERGQTEVQAMQQEAAAIEDLMAMTHWDEALSRARQLAAAFPRNAQAQAILARVVRERDLYRDSTTRQLWDEVKRQVEHRQWRKALSAGRRLSEQFADHKLAHRVREQLPTLTENAEIEERHEREQRIHDLVSRKRYADAIEMANQLLSEFPQSPQGQTLRDLLPKLREKLLEQQMSR
jgi:hypothetical protein